MTIEDKESPAAKTSLYYNESFPSVEVLLFYASNKSGLTYDNDLGYRWCYQDPDALSTSFIQLLSMLFFFLGDGRRWS